MPCSVVDRPVVEVRGLTKSYGNQVVLDELSLAVGPGVHALLGPNGAGKTTLVNILSTLVRADGGTARILGHDVRRDRAQVRRLISVTGQYAAVDELLTGTENLVMMARLLGLGRRAARARAGELLDQFDLTGAAGRQVRTYSGGMRRRLDLAVSLIAGPAVLFLDEPTTGLDTRSRRALWQQIRRLAAEGTTVFLTTQYLEEADALAEHVLVLDGGAIVAQGTPAQLKSRVGGAVLELQDVTGQLVREVATDGSAADVARALATLAEESPRARVAVRRPTLDEAFLQLTGQPATTVAAGLDDEKLEVR